LGTPWFHRSGWIGDPTQVNLVGVNASRLNKGFYLRIVEPLPKR
jgi:hypothetical protein